MLVGLQTRQRQQPGRLPGVEIIEQALGITLDDLALTLAPSGVWPEPDHAGIPRFKMAGHRPEFVSCAGTAAGRGC